MSARDDVPDPVVIEIVALRASDRIRLIIADGVEIRRTSRDVLKLASVESGTGFTPESIAAVIAEHEESAALERATRLLAGRDFSVETIRARLTAEGYPSEVVSSVLARLIDRGHLDDERFADSFVRSKAAAGWGRGRIARALSEAGVTDVIPAEALQRYLPEEAELERALQLLRPISQPTKRDAARAVARLVRKGFSYDVARAAVMHGLDKQNH